MARHHDLARELVERLLAAGPPHVHLALAGTLAIVTTIVDDGERAWQPVGGDEWPRGQRDRALLAVAGRARAARREAAWTAIAAPR